MSELKSFYRHFSSVRFKKGEIIIHQGETPKYVYAVKNGIIESYNLTSGGDLCSNSFATIDDIIPACWAFSKTTSSIFYHQAYSDCDLYVINKQDFLAKINESHRFAAAMLNRQAQTLIAAKLHVDALERHSSYEKLLYIFRYFCLLYGRSIGSDLTKIQIPLAQQKIANFTGLTRETVTIDINKMKLDKVITVEHMYYTVDTHKLNLLIDSDCNPGILVSMLR